MALSYQLYIIVLFHNANINQIDFIIIMQNRQSKQFRQSLKRQSIKIPQKDVSYFIHSIQPLQNRSEDYQKALILWNEFSAIRKNQKKQTNKILTTVSKKVANSKGSNLCQVCYQQNSKKKNWCKICGNQCCQKCLGRFRVVDNQQEPVPFCEKCDKKYMIAMIVKEEEQNFQIRQKSFLKLAEEQQMIQSLLKIQRKKLGNDQNKQKNQLLQKMNEITDLTTQNQILKHQIAQIKKKVEWGQQIKAHLRKKLKKLKRDQSHSFTSSTHQENDRWAPPKADQQEYVSMQNLNESIINSMLQSQVQQPVKNTFKCTCSIF